MECRRPCSETEASASSNRVLAMEIVTGEGNEAASERGDSEESDDEETGPCGAAQARP